MATWDDVRRIALAQPKATEGTSHLEGAPIALVRLDAIDVAALEEVVVEAWLARAPPTLRQARPAGPPRR